jgi:hypothetical protein
MGFSLTTDELLNLAGLVVTVGCLIIGVRRLARRETLIKAQFERIKGNSKCEGAAAAPAGAALLVATDETDGGIKQGQIWLKDKNLYIARIFLSGNTDLLCAFYATPYLRVSLPDVAYAKADDGLLTLGLPSVPCEVAMWYVNDRRVTGFDKLAAALKENLPCPLEGEATLTPARP